MAKVKSKKSEDDVSTSLRVLETLSKASYSEISKVIQDRIVFGYGIWEIDENGKVKHVPFLDWINEETE